MNNELHDKMITNDQNDKPPLVEVQVSTPKAEKSNAAQVEMQKHSFAPDEEDLIEIEKQTAKMLNDQYNLSRAVFQDEGKATKFWLLFLTIYWTGVVWINTVATSELSNSALAMWCVAAVGLFGAWYLYREGKYPSGSTKENPNETFSSGRYAAIYLNIVICVDICYLSYSGIEKGFEISDIILSCCHVIGIVWGSLFFFNRFRRQNPDVATAAFFSEWFDLGVSYIVIFILHRTINIDKSCFDQAICVVYFFYMVCKLVGWVFPMTLLRGWGTEPKAKIVCTHLFILDLLTDLPIAITLLIEGTYKSNGLIFFDIMLKTCLLIRSIAYYIIYNIWLEKGGKLFSIGTQK